MKPLCSLLPELKLDDKAAEVLTPAWIKATKAQCLKLASSGKMVKLGKGIVGDYLGMVQKCKVFAVDSDQVNALFYPKEKGDFCEAGNHGRFPGIPEGQIWLDSVFAPTDKAPHIVAHEISELTLMSTLGWSYDRAHRTANVVEWSWVKEGETDGKTQTSDEETSGSRTSGPISRASATGSRAVR